MTTSVAKIIKGSTSAVIAHRQAQERAWGIYTAGMARLQADYIERCRQADEQYLDTPGEQSAQPNGGQSAEQPEQPEQPAA